MGFFDFFKKTPTFNSTSFKNPLNVVNAPLPVNTTLRRFFNTNVSTLNPLSKALYMRDLEETIAKTEVQAQQLTNEMLHSMGALPNVQHGIQSKRLQLDDTLTRLKERLALLKQTGGKRMTKKKLRRIIRKIKRANSSRRSKH